MIEHNEIAEGYTINLVYLFVGLAGGVIVLFILIWGIV